MVGNVNARALGTQGEDLALATYCQNGYKLVTRNWHYHRMGEIDLILSKEDLLIFCEVKLRMNPDFAEPSLSVGRVKRSRIRKLSQCFLTLRDEFADYHVRYDVCEIIPDKFGVLTANLIEDAF